MSTNNEINQNAVKHEARSISKPNANGSFWNNGLFFAFLSGSTVSVSSLMSKLAQRSTFLQITLLRTLLIGLSMASWWILSGQWKKMRDVTATLPMRLLGWLLIRTASSFTAMVTAYAVYQRISMGDASAIFGTTPVFTGLLGVVLLREAWQRTHVYLTLLTWIGIAFISKPGFLSRILPYGEMFDSSSDHQSSEQFYIGVALIVPLASSLSFIITRKLSQTIPPSFIICFTCIGVSFYSTIAMAMTETVRLPPFHDWKFLIPEVISGLTSQTLTSMALQREKAAPVILMRNSSIFFSFVFQYLVFNNLPSWSSVLGAMLVVLSTGLLRTVHAKQ